MKKLISTLVVALCFFGLVQAALTSADYFEGKWSVLIKDTPQGDATIPMRFETIDGKTTGYFVEDASGTEKKMSAVTIANDVLTAYFNISGYDVDLQLKKGEADFSAGSLMSQFPAEATRVKE